MSTYIKTGYWENSKDRKLGWLDLDALILKISGSSSVKNLMSLTVVPPPANPADGDIWLESNTDTGLKIRINGVTKTISIV